MTPNSKSAAPRWRRPTTPDWAKRGYAHLFNETILQADEGCDFDFMRGEGQGIGEHLLRISSVMPANGSAEWPPR